MISETAKREVYTVNILQAHIASTLRATNMRTEGVEDEAVLFFIDSYILAYSDWIMKPILVSSFYNSVVGISTLNSEL